MKNIQISKATVVDAEGIQHVVTTSSKGMYALCEWSQEDISKHFNPEKIAGGAEKLRNSIATFTDADILFVAKDEDNRIVGCCFADKQEAINKIEAMYLLEEFQGTGLAKKLYDNVYELLNPNNDTFLDVFSLNSKAITFYKKMGFSETGKKFFDERFVDSDDNKLEITEMKLSEKNSSTVYQKPYTIDEIKVMYPEMADMLLKDEIHVWRAQNGIELIHKEPTREEQLRIWNNWLLMPDELKIKSDEKSLEVFGKNNREHHEEIMKGWERQNM